MSRQRDSNIELLRVVSIFLVLVVHANMLHNGIGAPGLGDLQSYMDGYFLKEAETYIPSIMAIRLYH